MSKEVIDYNREELLEHIRDYNPDMLEKFDETEIADIVTEIATLLGTRKGRVIDYSYTTCGGILTYNFKVSNTHGGFVSCTCEETGTTGVSRTTYYPYICDSDEETIYPLCGLMEMVNEAWYQCNN
jgi:hypothetical protein